ncbi:unnamed protein product [Peronospora farinosa]|uniref:RxLR effector protein n=1 Tax=Peronospora farinosa TaxID=134698 RepID=A0AAV0U981_9STRA|nr:unnamed protein product [Peronospora farinosa]CAI5733376.1 unnamed protein product [Peronospora farinosa]
MRFNILVAPVVAAFVASCSCFVSAEVAALDGYTHDGKEVVRRLREDRDVQEERLLPGFNFLNELISKMKPRWVSRSGYTPEAAALYAKFHKGKKLKDFLKTEKLKRLQKEGEIKKKFPTSKMLMDAEDETAPLLPLHSTKEVVRQLIESFRKLANNRATIVFVSTTIAPPSDS